MFVNCVRFDIVIVPWLLAHDAELSTMRYRLCHRPSLDENVVLFDVTISPSVKMARSALRLIVVLFENVSVQPPVMRATNLVPAFAAAWMAVFATVQSL